MEDELVIDETNFEQYFFDVRKNKPQEGQVMAKFTAIAAFGEGTGKQDVVNLLKKGRAEQASRVMQKLHWAKVPDCYKVCREISEDLVSGMSEQEVISKEYEYVLEAYYYTQREYVPKDDPRWDLIQLMRLDEDGVFKVDIEL